MTVLALDAARGAFSCAVVRDARALASEQIDGRTALEGGLAAVSRVLEAAGATGGGIQRIGVGIGPGSFTGVRIAISYAKSLALAWNVPLVGVDTFDALEEGLDLELPAFAVVRGRTGVISVRLKGDDGTIWRGSGYVRDVLDQLCHAEASKHPEAPRGELTILGDAEDVQAGLAERGWTVQRVSEKFSPAAVAVAIASEKREPAASAHAVRADYGELPPAKVPKL